MSSQQLDEERIFHLAREIPGESARLEYLDQVCAGDRALRERVEELLRVHEQEQSFLKSGGDPLPTEAIGELNIAPGQQIGRYKLLQKIGEGGFGVVFMAEQSRPVRRKVALKVIKPGMDSQAVVARFEAERQALAMMDHPNIARVFDGGETEGGRPYFVMELVKGVPITEYCDKNELSTEQRLELFTTVCQAVQHAHQKGIIHRDLKPSNVLVTLADGKPVVKVIDFGVAKATNQQLTEKTLFTAFGQMVGTPQYMSPEQAEMSCLDVDTRSDVYSLGVLLYELLTGTTPLEAERLRTAGYAEMQRLIREEEPPKPSTRLSTSGDKLTIIAKHRKVTPEKLKSQVQGDLDWIVMKALEKDRNRRYATPLELSDEVVRSLANEPIEACPPSTAYRLKKFVHRNRNLVLGVTAFTLVLLMATTFASWGWVRAVQEKERANSAVIESLMLQAVAGELEDLDVAIGEARGLGVPEDWLLTLKGVAHVHRAEMNDAVAALQRALEENPDNVSAKAMLSFAYILNGDWEDWYLLADELMTAGPRPEYAEFDRLFLGYGWFYIDQQESADRLEAVLAEHPTWYIPRAVLAIAWGHVARREWTHDDHEAGDKYARKALNEIRAPMVLSGENPFVLTCCFYVFQTAAENMEADQDSNLQTARDLAERLGTDHQNYAVGSLLRATFFEKLYQDTGDDAFREAEESAWKDMLKYGNGTMQLWPAAAFLNDSGDEDFDIVTALKDRGGEGADLARAYVLAVSQDESEREVALKIFHRLKSATRTWFGQHTLVQIPLLAGEPELARQQCRKWMENSTGSEGLDDDSWWERESIRFLATGNDRGLKLNAENPGEKWFASYQQGMLSISDRRWTEALDHFTACNDHTYYPRGAFRRFWTMALEEHLERKLGKPRDSESTE